MQTAIADESVMVAALTDVNERAVMLERLTFSTKSAMRDLFSENKRTSQSVLNDVPLIVLQMRQILPNALDFLLLRRTKWV